MKVPALSVYTYSPDSTKKTYGESHFFKKKTRFTKNLVDDPNCESYKWETVCDWLHRNKKKTSIFLKNDIP